MCRESMPSIYLLLISLRLHRSSCNTPSPSLHFKIAVPQAPPGFTPRHSCHNVGLGSCSGRAVRTQWADPYKAW
ncbi:hypothetical protein GDO81_007073 [Engystomops pustulosus]|uniref:Secreted protein n=1 Tax=Engystomops pustulosus TaxID=76066 RepID=A0AAV7C4X7_ENGPU|nr:hypothetical protein GDO81_007073 [Engystomops pustulosus]